jgi:hypothetical protein
LLDQEAVVRQAVEAAGGQIVHTASEEVRGCVADAWLQEVAEEAKRRGATALVAHDVTRFARPLMGYDDDRYDQHDAYRRDDLQRIAEATEGLVLYTVIPPDATPGERRSAEIKRGQEAKGRKGGRPRKPSRGEFKAIWQPRFVRWWWVLEEEDLPERNRIAAIQKMAWAKSHSAYWPSRTTIQKWLRESGISPRMVQDDLGLGRVNTVPPVPSTVPAAR